jgi:hypothetical protein
MRILGRTSVTLLVVVTCLANTALASDEVVLSRFSQTIAKESRLTDTRRSLLIGAARETLSQYGDLGVDKQKRAGEDLKAYLDDVLPGKESYSDSQFAVVMQSFKWSLGNYARLEPISDQDRQRAYARVTAVGQAMKEYVDKVYTDTPPDVRQEIIDRVAGSLEAVKTRSGNYFYPAYLYPAASSVDTDSIVANLSQQPLTPTYAKRFARVASLLADNSLTEESRKFQRDSFIANEAFSMTNAAMTAMSATCDLLVALKKGQYAMPPKDLLDAQAALVKEVAEAGRKAVEQNAAKHQAQVLQNILDQGKIRVQDGMVELAADSSGSEESVQQTEPAGTGRVPATSPAKSGGDEPGTRWQYGLAAISALMIGGAVTVLLSKRRRGVRS